MHKTSHCRSNKHALFLTALSIGHFKFQNRKRSKGKSQLKKSLFSERRDVARENEIARGFSVVVVANSNIQVADAMLKLSRKTYYFLQRGSSSKSSFFRWDSDKKGHVEGLFPYCS